MSGPESSSPHATDTAGRAPDAFDRLIAPVSRSVFFDAHWERAPLHVGRDRDGHFAHLLSMADIEALLSRGEARHPDVQLVRTGAPVPVDDYTDAARRVLPRPLARHHRAGATLILSQAHRRFDALAALVRELQTSLGWRCQANAYLSPAGCSGFAPHHDTHDVFVLQVAGRKAFRFHTGGIDCPFTDERYDPALAGPREARETVELSPGDTLYIPRGVVHDAIAREGGPSLHITVGVFPAVLRDLLVEAVQVAAERDVALRRSIPGRVWGATGEAADARWIEALRASLDAALDEVAVATALSRLRDAASVGAAADATGLLRDAASVDAVGPDTVLVVDVPSVRLQRDGDTLRLRRPGEVLEFTGPNAIAVEDLVTRGDAPVSALAGLDASAATALARRLVELGVCRTARRGAHDPLVGSPGVG